MTRRLTNLPPCGACKLPAGRHRRLPTRGSRSTSRAFPQQGCLPFGVRSRGSDGVSRTPVREALLRLETEGFVQIIPKRGIYVPPIGDDEVTAAMEARELLEDWCVRRAMSRADIADELYRLIDTQTGLADDPVAFIEADRAFHRAILRRAGNPVIAGFYESLRERQVRMGVAAQASSPERTSVVLAEHRAIADAVHSGDPEAAAKSVKAPLSSTLSTLNRLASTEGDH